MGNGVVKRGVVRTDPSVHVAYRQLLRMPNLRQFAMAQGTGQTADAMLTVFLARHLLFINPEGPSTARLTQMCVTALFPLVLAGPMSGVLADRMTRRGILVTGHVARSFVALVTIGAIASVDQTVLLVMWGLSLCLSRVMYTVRAVAVRHIVRQHEIVAADAVLLSIGSASGVVGGMAGFLMSQAIGYPSLLVVVLGHLLAARWFGSLSVNIGGGRDHEPAEWRTALRALSSPKIRYAALATTTHRFLVGSLFAGTVLLVDARSGNSAGAYATVVGTAGAGGIAGAPLAEWVNEHFPRRSTTVMSFASASGMVGAALYLDNRAAYLVTLAFTAMVFQILRVESDSTVQANAPRGAGGRVFAAYDISFNLAYVVGILWSLFAAGHRTVTGVMSLDAGVFGVLTVVFAVLDRGKRVESPGLGPVSTATDGLGRSTGR